MRKHTIILDFTSLLDIIMVILFFFIIFSKFETDEVKTKYDQKLEQITQQQEEIDIKLTEAQYKEDEAEKKQALADQRFEMADSAEEHSGDNAKAITDMIQGKNIKLSLAMGDNKKEWSLRIIKENDLISEIQYSNTNQVYKELKQVLEDNKYEKDKTMIVDFLYDAEEKGTTAAYSNIQKVFDKLQKDYSRICISETDLSMLN